MKTPTQYLQEAKGQIATSSHLPSKNKSWKFIEQAALLAIENAIKDAQPKWIDVKEALPETDDQVLTFDEYGNRSIGYYDKTVSSLGWQDANEDNLPIIVWQPLPPPPKQFEP